MIGERAGLRREVRRRYDSLHDIEGKPRTGLICKLEEMPVEEESDDGEKKLRLLESIEIREPGVDGEITCIEKKEELKNESSSFSS